MTTECKEKLIKEIKEKFNFYVPGDMKKMTKFLKSKELDIVNITHNSNYGGLAIAASIIVFWNHDDSESEILTDSLEIIWG